MPNLWLCDEKGDRLFSLPLDEWQVTFLRTASTMRPEEKQHRLSIVLLQLAESQKESTHAN